MVIPPPIQYERDEAAPSASSLSLARALSLKSISICLAYADVRCIFDDVITVAKVWQRRWRWIACLCTKSKINVEVTDGVHRPPPPILIRTHTRTHTQRHRHTHTHRDTHTHTHTIRRLEHPISVLSRRCALRCGIYADVHQSDDS